MFPLHWTKAMHVRLTPSAIKAGSMTAQSSGYHFGSPIPESTFLPVHLSGEDVSRRPPVQGFCAAVGIPAAREVAEAIEGHQGWYLLGYCVPRPW